ncbi:MAG: hypothetical protein IID45_05685 [Planctomycetes bacterium]|nr:hypothetical protein [Planctomycetota bacterium]
MRPNWIGKTDSFWYSYRTSRGTDYVRVDPVKRTKKPLFDHVKLAAQLSVMTKRPLDPNQLSLSRMSLDSAGLKMKFGGGAFQ